MNFTKRRVTTKSNSSQDEFEEIEVSFLSEVVETVDMNDISPKLIFDWDQNGINLILAALWTNGQTRKEKNCNSRLPRQMTDHCYHAWY